MPGPRTRSRGRRGGGYGSQDGEVVRRGRGDIVGGDQGGGRGLEEHSRNGGAQRRPHANKDIHIGMIEDLPLGSGLEVPLHPKRMRTLNPHNYQTGYWSTWSSLVRDSPAIEPAPDRSLAANSPAIKPAPDCSLAENSLAIEPEPLVVSTAGARAPSPCQINDMLIGSNDSDEEEEQDDDVACEIQVPRRVRMFLEAEEEDTPQDRLAVGTIETFEALEPRAVVADSEITPENLAAATVQAEPMRSSSFCHFTWGPYPDPPIPPHQRREIFTGTCGPTTAPSASPYGTFAKIWDRPIMEHICHQTNLYAQQYAASLLDMGAMEPSSRIAFWKDTDVDEMYIYFALLMAMSITVKSKLVDYWCEDRSIFATPGFRLYMTLRRFQLISRCLHFSDNAKFSSALPRSQQKLFKIQPILDHLNRKFQSLYKMSQNIALDESLTQWKGRLDIRQFIPDKAATTGIKTYEVCDSQTGYLWRFEVHVGGELVTCEGSIANAIPNLVLRLLYGLENIGHTVWMDNYYNSPALARLLKKLKFDCVGTLRTNRLLVPDEISNLKKSDMRVGEVCGCTSGDVDLLVWRDKNRVALISTYHGVAVSNHKPTVVRDYNICMGGVDKKDQMVSMYPMERKRTKVWYKKFFRRLLNVSLLNAYIIHKHHTPINHRDFRTSLVKEILQIHQTSPVLVETYAKTPKLSAEVLAHFPSQLPTLPGGGNQKRQCVVCKTKRSTVVCNACGVALCFNLALSFESCYVKFHSKSNHQTHQDKV